MKKILMILIIGLALALAAFSCKESDSPTPHKSTITAFGKTITVKGDASISTDDFNAAKEKLGEAMTYFDTNMTSPAARAYYTNMLNRSGFAIIIKTGNATPNADANKSMTIGVNYLLHTNAVGETASIAVAIHGKVFTDDAFADNG
jgi:hypothetical protein